MCFGSPTYMGNMLAKPKNFQDKSSPLFVKGAWKDTIAPAFTVAASKVAQKVKLWLRWQYLLPKTECIG